MKERKAKNNIVPQFFTGKQVTLHKASGTQQFVSKLTLRSFALLL